MPKTAVIKENGNGTEICGSSYSFIFDPLFNCVENSRISTTWYAEFLGNPGNSEISGRLYRWVIIIVIIIDIELVW